MFQMETSSAVSIIGAGPVGLYTALLLGQAGIETHVFEREAFVLQTPRAAAYFPITLNEFEKSGILDDVVNAGFKNTVGVSWRKPKCGGVLAYLGAGDSFAIHLGQHELADIILKHLEKCASVTVCWNTAFDRMEELEGTGQVKIMLSHGADRVQQTHVSQYVVGADGGKSAVRKMLDIPLEGFTWKDFTIIAANIEYDLENQSDWGPASYVVDPNLWAVVAKTGKGCNWRVATGEKIVAGATEDTWDEAEGTERMRRRIEAILPGDIDKVKIVKISPYSMHQRCVSTFRKGRVVLAGDAAHLTNPVGGLGLTTGILDAAFLGHLLKRILLEGESDALLDTYAAKRREAFIEHTSPMATANRLRLSGTEPEVVTEREHYFKSINNMDMDFLINMVDSENKISSTINL
ncbi:hypothetical protein LTR84_009000 [Exophiala bonariae]|uniref:FAD-binding domain-containing protein n=1 Tax=Exophiala bonariae TaxID=1690606 RepID=A0AAV9MZ35_9EURO|nr:hypothetical protein LTR84_009000 [Exophiala bonariae]